MLANLSVASRSGCATLQRGSRLLSSAVPRTPEEIKQDLERAGRMTKFLQKPANTRMPVGVGSGADLHLPKNISELAALSGMPAEHAKRTVLIGQRQFKLVQSGYAYSHQWQITWKHEERWLNPLMGWGSSADPMAQVKLHFDTKEEAVRFADRNGWTYEFQQKNDITVKPAGFKSYKENFLPTRTVLQLEKEGMKNKIFENPGYGKSNWFMPLTYHGDGEVVQHGPSRAALN